MSAPALLLCVERGLLEPQAILCVESLRTWGGALADMPVYTFAPRRGNEPAGETVAALRALGVEHIELGLNERHADLPHCNKVYVAAWAEAELNHAVLAFTDSDTLFLGEPHALAGDEGWSAAARPVGSASAASTGEGHENEPAWQAVYSALGVRSRPFVETAVDHTPIRAYFNAGLIAGRREAGVFGSWARALDRLLEPGVIRSDLLRQADQLAFAGAVSDGLDRLSVLPPTYNYPLPRRSLMAGPERHLDLEDLVHVHGHRWLHLAGFLDELEPPFDTDSARYRWLADRLPLEPQIDEPFRFSKDRTRRRVARRSP